MGHRVPQEPERTFKIMNTTRLVILGDLSPSKILRARDVMLRHAALAHRNGRPEVAEAYEHAVSIMLRNFQASVRASDPPRARSAKILDFLRRG